MNQSLTDFRERNDFYWESVTYRWLSNILAMHGMIKMEERVDHHLQLARKAGERKNLAEALRNKAFQLYVYNHLNEARKYAEEANKLFTEIGVDFDYSKILFVYFAWLESDYEKAKWILMDMRERYKTSGEKNWGLIVSSELGLVALEEKDFAHAHIYLEESLAAARALDDKDAIAWRFAELGNVFYLEGKLEEFKDSYGKGFSLSKELRMFAKRDFLVLALDPLYTQQPESTVWLLGALDTFAKESTRPVSPLLKRNYDRAEKHTRNVLDNAVFEMRFAEGQKMSLDEGLDVAQKIIEEM
jgi:tetratricopeptide (TPR) repeat protein